MPILSTLIAPAHSPVNGRMDLMLVLMWFQILHFERAGVHALEINTNLY